MDDVSFWEVLHRGAKRGSRWLLLMQGESSSSSRVQGHTHRERDKVRLVGWLVDKQEQGLSVSEMAGQKGI